ncbi:MAG: N-6 DNA methylase [Polyangiaceae bacterium]|nr:N-6 DNA methylase [Polyangiaceae bacterium]
MPKRHTLGAGDHRLIAHIEEIVVATSGADAFEMVFGLAAARMLQGRRVRSIRKGIAQVAKNYPMLGIVIPPSDADELLARVDALLARAWLNRPHAGGSLGAPNATGAIGAIDAIFESLVPRMAKGDKGQFFTPRHVVDFIVRSLAPRAGERVIDPACGSGAFLSHARANARVETFGCDVDARAVRVARLSAMADGRLADTIVVADGLSQSTLPSKFAGADVIATNPPFAGRAPSDNFEVARVMRSPERDVLFVERSLSLLRPGGRLGIVLPYNKAGGAAFAAWRQWLATRARLLAVVALPRETFLPHTSQRTFVLFAKKRAVGEAMNGRERTMLLISSKAGKNSAGEPMITRHDLDEIFSHLAPFLAAEGFFA